jgi:hypothetical protein
LNTPLLIIRRYQDVAWRDKPSHADHRSGRTFWQYTSSGTVRGVDSPGATDLSGFNTRQVGLIDPGTQRSRAGTKVSLQVNSLDKVARRPLRYRAAGLPPRLAITRAGTITGRVSGPSRTYRVTVWAANPARAVGTVSFSWQVSP